MSYQREGWAHRASILTAPLKKPYPADFIIDPTNLTRVEGQRTVVRTSFGCCRGHTKSDFRAHHFLFPPSMQETNDIDLPILVIASEAWTFEVEDDHRFAFMAYVWRRGEEHYHLRHPERRTSSSTLFDSALLIPRECYMPYPSSDLTTVPEGLEDSNVYHKRPTLLDFEPGSISDRTAQTFLHEAQICQTLMSHPHPNLCQYFGYKPSKDGRIASLLLTRHTKSLVIAIKEDKIDIARIISEVNSGLEHLHSLVLVHVIPGFQSSYEMTSLQNDINAPNVVIDESGSAVIIDFDSCWPIGESLIGKKVGADSDISSIENDRIAVEQLRTWLGEMASEFNPEILLDED